MPPKEGKKKAILPISRISPAASMSAVINTVVTPRILDTSDTPSIPLGLPKTPQKWSPDDVKAYLKHNQKEYFLDDEDIDIIRQNKVAGLDFLKLTRKDLREAPYNLKDGPAARIDALINWLKKPKRK